MPLTAQEALDVSKQFRELAISLGNHRFDHWENLTRTERQDLEDEEWSLLNASSYMITRAVGLALDDSRGSILLINKSITKAESSIRKLKKVSQIIIIAAAAVGLAAAIVSKDLGSIAKNVKLLRDAADVLPVPA